MNTFPPDPPAPEIIMDLEDRVLVMGSPDGWKVELYAREGGDSITLRDNFETMDDAELWAGDVREILEGWDGVLLY